MTDVTIRVALPRDLEMVTDVHVRSFPNFFLSALGPRFLRLLYEEILRSETGVLVVADDGSGVVGLAAGTTTQSGFYRALLRRRLIAFALAAAPAALRRPVIVPRLFRALRRPAESASAAAPACLMSLAVHPRAEGQGIGARLVTAFCEELRSRGADGVCLTTDAAGNDPVNRFYQRQGFRATRSITTPEGRVLNEYVRKL